MADNQVPPKPTRPFVEDWPAVVTVGIIFFAIAVVGVCAVYRLAEGAEAVAVIAALTTAGGTIVGALGGASIGGAGRAAAERRAEEAGRVAERQTAEATEARRGAETAESEARRNREEVDIAKRSASAAGAAVEKLSRLLSDLEDKIKQRAMVEEIAPPAEELEELGKIDKELSAVSEALSAITRQPPVRR